MMRFGTEHLLMTEQKELQDKEALSKISGANSEPQLKFMPWSVNMHLSNSFNPELKLTQNRDTCSSSPDILMQHSTPSLFSITAKAWIHQGNVGSVQGKEVYLSHQSTNIDDFNTWKHHSSSANQYRFWDFRSNCWVSPKHFMWKTESHTFSRYIVMYIRKSINI